MIVARATIGIVVVAVVLVSSVADATIDVEGARTSPFTWITLGDWGGEIWCKEAFVM